jgi:hypothetical protein
VRCSRGDGATGDLSGPPAERRPEDPGEARWNYACWILEGFEKLGNVPEDPAGGPVYEAEVKRLGAWFDSEDEEDEGEIDAKSDLLRLHFYDAVIDLARQAAEEL